jgi:transcriptional antiterminator Rof (Rho-off)
VLGDGSILSEVINALNINAEAYGVDINEESLEADVAEGLELLSVTQITAFSQIVMGTLT